MSWQVTVDFYETSSEEPWHCVIVTEIELELSRSNLIENSKVFCGKNYKSTDIMEVNQATKIIIYFILGSFLAFGFYYYYFVMYCVPLWFF